MAEAATAPLSPPTATGRPDVAISIILPCLNEEGAVGACVRDARAWIERSGLTGEVIVVDNGSTDNSAREAEAAGAVIVREPVRGKGNACLAGFAAASGRTLVLADADGTYDFGDLDVLLAALDGDTAMVIGDRRAAMEREAMPWLHRRVGNPLISLMARTVTGLPVHDVLSGMRVIRRDALDAMMLRTTHFEIEVEMLMRAARLRLPVREVPVRYLSRTGDSKLRSFRDGWAMTRFMLLYTPELALMLPGGLMTLAGLVALGFTLLAGAGVDVGSLRWQPVFAGPALVTIGTTALLLGLISDLYSTNRGLKRPGRLTLLYRRHGSFERLLQVAAVLVVFGLALDAVLLARWFLGYGNDVPAAAAAQTAIMVGANFALAGFVTALLEHDGPARRPAAQPDDG